MVVWVTVCMCVDKMLKVYGVVGDGELLRSATISGLVSGWDTLIAFEFLPNNCRPIDFKTELF